MKLNNVPHPKSDWSKLSAFALTFDPHEIGAYGQHANNLDNALKSSSISELRAHLYIEKLRWNHFGREPDEMTMKKLREIIQFIQQKLT